MNIEGINTFKVPVSQPAPSSSESRVPLVFQFTQPFVASDRCFKITSIPILDKLIEVIIWLFKKIFPSCVPDEKRIQSKEMLDEILTDHPTWQNAVDSWKGVSIEDKVWLLMLYELHHLKSGRMESGQKDYIFVQNTFIPHLGDLHSGEPQYSHLPSSRSPELLLLKKDIEQFLDSINEIIVEFDVQFTKCPKAIRLLRNLKDLIIFDCKLKEPPDLRWNTKLQCLSLMYNSLEQPSDLSCNVELGILRLNNNKLVTPPALTKNPKLTDLDLSHNQLTSYPDFSKNTKLKNLVLEENPLKESPDLSKNINLEMLVLNSTQITTPPDLKFHPNLFEFYINDNKLIKLPDFSHNGNLHVVSANNCQLTQAPFFDKNPKMKLLFLDNNLLKNLPKLSLGQALYYFTIKNNPLKLSAKSKLKVNPNMSWPKYAVYPHCYGL